jgi:hypothetical protein
MINSFALMSRNVSHRTVWIALRDARERDAGVAVQKRLPSGRELSL